MGSDIGSRSASATKNGAGATDAADAIASIPEYFGTVSISILNRNGVAIVDILPSSINAIEKMTRNLIPNAYCRSF